MESLDLEHDYTHMHFSYMHAYVIVVDHHVFISLPYLLRHCDLSHAEERYGHLDSHVNGAFSSTVTNSEPVSLVFLSFSYFVNLAILYLT